MVGFDIDSRFGRCFLRMIFPGAEILRRITSIAADARRDVTASSRFAIDRASDSLKLWGFGAKF